MKDIALRIPRGLGPRKEVVDHGIASKILKERERKSTTTPVEREDREREYTPISV